jgi:hypothetical protein
MRAQLRQWDTYDRANASGRFVPEWKVEMPGIFSITGVCWLLDSPYGDLIFAALLESDNYDTA